jgi:SAM-dependent methyltransferase
VSSPYGVEDIVGLKVGSKRDFLLLERAGHRFNQLKLAFNLLSGCDGSRILDIGCGQGLLEEYFEDRHCVGMDIDFGSVGIAKDRAPQARYMLGDIHNLPIKTGTFDVVAMMAVLGSVASGKEDHVFDEARRVLCTGGSLVILVSQDVEPYSLLVPDRLFHGWRWRHFDAQSLEIKLTETGFLAKKVVFAGGILSLALDLLHHLWNRCWRLLSSRIIGKTWVPGLPCRKLSKVESLEFKPFRRRLRKFARYIYIVAEKK